LSRQQQHDGERGSQLAMEEGGGNAGATTTYVALVKQAASVGRERPERGRGSHGSAGEKREGDGGNAEGRSAGVKNEHVRAITTWTQYEEAKR